MSEELSTFFNQLCENLIPVLEESNCVKCKQKVIDPVQIKACSHYYCLKCFDKKSSKCPKCSTIYSSDDVDHLSMKMLDPSIKLLSELHDLLKSDSVSSEIPRSEIEIDDRTHVLHFIDGSHLKRNAKGETNLHTACRKKDMAKVRAILENDFDLNIKDFAGWAPLHDAIVSGNYDIVEMLLKNGALVNIPGENYSSPLHKAVLEENVRLIKLLKKYGADLKAIDKQGRIPADLTLKENIKQAIDEPLSVTVFYGQPKLFVQKDIIAYCHSIDSSYSERLMKSKNKFIKVTKDFNLNKDNLTHLIIKKSHKPSYKILLSMVAGLFIVNQEWIDFFLNNDFCLPLAKENWIIWTDWNLNNGIKKAMLNKLLGRPKLFDGINFYIEKHKASTKYENLTITDDFLKKLITAGGGKLLSRAPTPRTVTAGQTVIPYHLTSCNSLRLCHNFIIYQLGNPITLKYNMTDLKHKSSDWLLASVFSFTFQPFME